MNKEYVAIVKDFTFEAGMNFYSARGILEVQGTEYSFRISRQSNKKNHKPLVECKELEKIEKSFNITVDYLELVETFKVACEKQEEKEAEKKRIREEQNKKERAERYKYSPIHEFIEAIRSSYDFKVESLKEYQKGRAKDIVARFEEQYNGTNIKVSVYCEYKRYNETQFSIWAGGDYLKGKPKKISTVVRKVKEYITQYKNCIDANIERAKERNSEVENLTKTIGRQVVEDSNASYGSRGRVYSNKCFAVVDSKNAKYDWEKRGIQFNKVHDGTYTIKKVFGKLTVEQLKEIVKILDKAECAS